MAQEVDRTSQAIQRLITNLQALSGVSQETEQRIRSLISGLKGVAAGRGINEELIPTIENIRKIGRAAGLTSEQINKLDKDFLRLAGTIRVAGKEQFRPLSEVSSLMGARRDVSLGTGGQRNLTPLFQGMDPQLADALPGGVNALRNVNKELALMASREGGVPKVVDAQVDMANQTARVAVEMDDLQGVSRSANIQLDRFGNTVDTSSRKTRGFGSQIFGNIGKVVAWGVAVGVVYGAIQQLNEVLETSIKIQEDFSRIQVVLGENQRAVSQIWGESADIAQLLGVSVVEVVDGFELALRAAGNIENEFTRIEVATQLMSDSMQLSKISGLEYASALDTLAGALRQSGLELDQGVRLLDKWVAVSREANVSISTLAESFAITATTAESAGLSVDELNAIIATVAETTTLTATEVGNATRAIIAGFQRDATQRQLKEYGIAVRDVNGELRGFLEIAEDIRARRDLGIISGREFNRLAEVIGGRGARRGAQVAALLNDLERIGDIVPTSSEASGDAAEALEIRMDNLQTALINLRNSFISLVEEGIQGSGLLTEIQALTESMTELINAVRIVNQIIDGLSNIPSNIGESIFGEDFVEILEILPDIRNFLPTRSPIRRGSELRQVGEGIFGDSPGVIESVNQLEDILNKVIAGETKDPGPLTSLLSQIYRLTLSEEDIEQIRQAVKDARSAAEDEASKFGEDNIFAIQLRDTIQQFGDVTSQVYENRLSEIREQLGRGEAGVEDLRGLREREGGFDIQVATIATALGDLQQATGIEDTEEAYASLASTILRATPEENDLLAELAGQIESVTQASQEGEDAVSRMFGARTAALRQELNNQIKLVSRSQRFQAFDPAQVVEVREGLSRQEIESIVQETRDVQERIVNALTADPTEQDKIRQSWEEVLFQIGDVFDDPRFTDIFEGLDPDLLRQVLEERGAQPTGTDGRQVQVLDVTSSQFEQLLPRLGFFENLVEQARGGQLEEEELGLIFKDNVTDTLHTDQLALQLLLQDLIEVNEQQLEGIFNIPEGMVAEIPFTGELFFSTEPINRGANTFAGAVDRFDQSVDDLSGGIEPRTQEAVIDKLSRGIGGARRVDRTTPPVTRSQEELIDKLNRFIGGARPSEARRINLSIGSAEERRQPTPGSVIGRNIDLQQILSAALPSSIPVTSNIEFEAPISVVIDGAQVMQMLIRRLFSDFKNAKRRTGTVGYVTE